MPATQSTLKNVLLIVNPASRRGAGLGLTLVQQIVESHGGKVELDSTLGSGSTFRLMFPLTLASSSPADVPSMVHARAF